MLTAEGKIEVTLGRKLSGQLCTSSSGRNFCGGASGIIIKISKRRKRGWRRALRTVVPEDIDCIYFKMENFMFYWALLFSFNARWVELHTDFSSCLVTVGTVMEETCLVGIGDWKKRVDTERLGDSRSKEWTLWLLEVKSKMTNSALRRDRTCQETLRRSWQMRGSGGRWLCGCVRLSPCLFLLIINSVFTCEIAVCTGELYFFSCLVIRSGWLNRSIHLLMINMGIFLYFTQVIDFRQENTKKKTLPGPESSFSIFNSSESHRKRYQFFKCV